MNRLVSPLLALVLLIIVSAPAMGADLDTLREKGTISFAISGQYPPFNFVNENNELAGFDVDVCSEIADRMGLEPRPVSTAWDGIVAGLLAGKYDLICGSMAITDQRLDALDFSDPYYRSGAQLFVPEGSSVDSVNALEGKKIGVTLGTTYEEWVRDNVSNSKVRTYKGVPDMVLEVSSGRLDGFITDRIVGAMAIDEKGAPIKMAGPLLYEERMGIAAPKDTPELVEAINEALENMKADSTYREISMKWLKIDAR